VNAKCEDMADAAVYYGKKKFLVHTHSQGKKKFGTPINVGTGTDISISDLANLIKSIVKFEGSFMFMDTDGTMKKLN
jgi:GDP-L-fucose synthase